MHVSGVTIALSSKLVVVETSEEGSYFSQGTEVVVFIAWPVLLEERQLLNLVLKGTVRAMIGMVVAIDTTSKHEFRPRG